MEGMSKTATTKRTSSSAPAFKSVAAQLLLRRGGGREAANGDSLEFFSDLRKCQPEPPRASGQSDRGGPGRPEDGRGMTRRRGRSDELLSSEIGKHDYDWLLTPPASPLRSPATNASGGNETSGAVPNQVARAGSAPYANSNSPLGRRGEKENSLVRRATGHHQAEKAMSRLARSSSAAQPSSINTHKPAFGGHLPRVRTLSSASVSSITTATGSNASVTSTSLTSSPRTPSSAKSARPCRRDKAASGEKRQQATGPDVVPLRQPWALSGKSSSRNLPAPTSSRRAHATSRPPSAASSPRSTTTTTSTCQEKVPPPTPSKRASVAARSRVASQGSGGTKSTAASSSPTPTTTSRRPRPDVHNTRDPRALTQSSSSVNTRAVSSTAQKWRQSLAPAIAAARSARRELLAPMDNKDDGSPRNGSGPNMVSADKAAAQRTPTTAASSGLPRRAGSRPKSGNSSNKPTKSDRHKHGDINPAHQKPASASQQWSSRSVSRSSTRHLLTRTTSKASGSISRGRSTPGADNAAHRRVAAARAAASAITVVSRRVEDAFPSSRHDAMLLREDPSNFTWLQGGDQEELVDASLEPFHDAATGGLSVQGR